MSSDIVKTHSTKVELLRHALSSRDIIYIWGLSGVGKTYVTRKILDEYDKYLYAELNCYDLAVPSGLFCGIINSLSSKLFSSGNRNETTGNISSIEFLTLYQELCRKISGRGYERVYIILDNVEQFCRQPMNDCVQLLAGMSSDLCNPINLVLISSSPLSNFFDSIKNEGFKLRLQDKLQIVALSTWTKDDVIDMILKQKPKLRGDLYETFVSNFTSIVHRSSLKSPSEIKRLCQDNFTRFLELFMEKLIELHQKQYQSDLSPSKILRYDPEDFIVDANFIRQQVYCFISTFKKNYNRGEFGKFENLDGKLVLQTRLLIIAVYVASHTRPSDDQRNFVKFQRKLKRKKLMRGHKDLDVKNFTLERLLHIYKGLQSFYNNVFEGSENESSIDESVLGDIQLLEELKIVHKTSGDGLDSSTRYKISGTITRYYVDELASALNLDLSQLSGLTYLD